ncbi:MAG TPA: OmpA family protein [Vicinamibacterales bacterium]|nr:OmpA family protein [Vicinamibacterales bacterium]
MRGRSRLCSRLAASHRTRFQGRSVEGVRRPDTSAGRSVVRQLQARERADREAVRKVLVDQGVDEGRITAKGYGSTKPIDKNDTPEGNANNRRVEFTKIS